LDLFLAQVLSSCYVDIMPGPSDPANIALPQQPFHPCLFPHSSRFNSFERVTNPHECQLDKVLIFGHSGQPVRDIARQSFELGSTQAAGQEEEEEQAEVQISSTEEESGEADMEIEDSLVVDKKATKMSSDMANVQRRLQILRRTLAWGHLCPTLPGKYFVIFYLVFNMHIHDDCKMYHDN
jgi:DNA polymerase II small subunit/DNA polymerase delta subunit B